MESGVKMDKHCNNCSNSMTYTPNNGKRCPVVNDCVFKSHWMERKNVWAEPESIGDLPHCVAPDTDAFKKPSNPKDAVGIRKWRQFCTVPFTVIWHIGVAMLEGCCKYGRHNYRDAGVRASVYIDAAMGHITQWWEGEDIDADSGLCHLDKAMASLVVLRDGMLHGNYNDDRPPKAKLDEIRPFLQGKVEEILDKYPNPVPPFTEEKHGRSD